MHFSSHFPFQPSLRNINHDKKDVNHHRKLLLVSENASQAAETPKISRTSPSLVKEKIMKNNLPKPRSPRRIPARRSEAAVVSPRQMSA